jgi:hypothetical protein
MQRLLMTIGALATALCLSASVALAAGPATPTGGAGPTATSCPGHSCSAHPAGGTTDTAQGKPANAGKPTTTPPNKGTDSDETEPDETDTETDDTDGNGPTGDQRPHNHGWYVSQVAQDHSVTGRAHGQAVSAEAHSSDGKTQTPSN